MLFFFPFVFLALLEYTSTSRCYFSSPFFFYGEFQNFVVLLGLSTWGIHHLDSSQREVKKTSPVWKVEVEAPGATVHPKKKQRKTTRQRNKKQTKTTKPNKKNQRNKPRQPSTFKIILKNPSLELLVPLASYNSQGQLPEPLRWSELFTKINGQRAEVEGFAFVFLFPTFYRGVLIFIVASRRSFSRSRRSSSPQHHTTDITHSTSHN